MKEHKKFLSVFLAMLIIGGIYLYRIYDLSSFYVLDDEFGYWSNGALLAGYDWAGTMRGVSYYSYGYGFLLAPIIRFINSPELMYQAAILLNTLMGEATFIIIFSCFDKLYPNINVLKKVAISLAICLCSNNIVNAHIAWSETLINLLVWFLLFLLILYLEFKQLRYLVLAEMDCIFMLMVHTRLIIILPAFAILLILLLSEKSLNFKDSLNVFLILLIGIFIWLFLRYYFKNAIWGIDGGSTNDFSSSIMKIPALFTKKGLSNFGMIFLGQLFYCGVSTILLSYYYLIYSSHKVLNAIKNHYFNKTIIIIFFFLLTTLLCSLFLGSLALINANRSYHFMYGRYSEIFVLPIVGLGAMETLSDNKSLRLNQYGITSIIIYIISGVLIKKYIEMTHAESYFSPNSSVLYQFANSTGNDVNTYKMLICIILGFCTICVLKPIFKQFSILLISLFIMVHGTAAAVNYINDFIMPAHQAHKKIQQLVDNNKWDDLPIYFLFDAEHYWGKTNLKAMFQIALKSENIVAKTQEELSSIEEEYYLLGVPANPFLDKLSNIKIKDSIDGYFIWERRNHIDDPMNSIDIHLDTFFNQNKNMAIPNQTISTGQAGYLLYGPYYQLNQAQYRVEVQFQILQSSEKDNYGYLEVVSGAQNYGRSFLQDSGSASVDFFIDAPTNNVEIRLYTEEGVVIKVDKVVLHKYEDGTIHLINFLRINSDIVQKQSNHAIQTNGNEGIVFWGPYKNIPKGAYTISITGKISSSSSSIIPGSFRIYNEQGKNLLSPVYNLNDFIEDGYLNLEVPLQLAEDAENVEFVLTESEGTIITIDTCTLEY